MKLRLELDLNWRSWRRGQRLLRLIMAVTLFLALQFAQPTAVDMLVGSYAFLALLFAFESGWSLVLGLITLCAVPFMLLLGQPGLANDYAVHSFYFLALGAISALLEATGSSESATATVIYHQAKSTSSE